MSTNTAPGRNSVGAAPMAAYVVGTVLVLVGIYLASITRINLLTGQTDHPDLVVGAVLGLIGLVLAGCGRLAGQRNLHK